MQLSEALDLIRQIIVFLVESFERTLQFMDGVKYYIAAVSIYLTVRYLLGPLLGRALVRGSDSAANRWR